VSRTMPDVTTTDHRMKAGRVREWMATIRDNEDLVSVGAYVPGSNPRIDESLQRRGPIEDFLRQPADALCSFSDAIGDLGAL
jgi:flagellum-specific ATP synthase